MVKHEGEALALFSAQCLLVRTPVNWKKEERQVALTSP